MNEKPLADTPPPSDIPVQDQKGPLQFRVGSAPGKVLIYYSSEVVYVELTPQIADEFAKALRKSAKKARRA
jgi:hypothetical protein